MMLELERQIDNMAIGIDVIYNPAVRMAKRPLDIPQCGVRHDMDGY